MEEGDRKIKSNLRLRLRNTMFIGPCIILIAE